MPIWWQTSDIGVPSFAWRRPKATYSEAYRDFFMGRSSLSVNSDHPTTLAFWLAQFSGSRSGANHTEPTRLHPSFPSVMIYRLPLPVIGTGGDPYKNIQLDPESMPGGDVPTWRIQRQLIHLSAAPALSPRVYLATVSALRHLPCFIVTLTGAPLSVMVRASPTRPECPL